MSSKLGKRLRDNQMRYKQECDIKTQLERCAEAVKLHMVQRLEKEGFSNPHVNCIELKWGEDFTEELFTLVPHQRNRYSTAWWKQIDDDTSACEFQKTLEKIEDKYGRSTIKCKMTK